jgi:peptide-methionine (S)-S-oxide reductase
MANTKTVYVAGGCFWGLEDLFREQPGVTDTEVGYSGGQNDNPTYEDHTGHAEALAITYDTDRTNYANILDFFFRIHNPTTKDRQGNDVGSSYRSAIFYQDDEELKTAKDMIKRVEESGLYKDPVVTTLEPFKKFWTAEEYHQDYLRKNPGGYTCHYVRTDKSLVA